MDRRLGDNDLSEIRATYRLQFHKDFTFRDAAALVPYLARLGISHLYASPLMEARPGSTPSYPLILRHGGEAVAELTGGFADLRGWPVSLARSRAGELQRRLSRRLADPEIAAAIEQALQAFAGRPGRPASFRRLHRLLEAQ